MRRKATFAAAVALIGGVLTAAGVWATAPSVGFSGVTRLTSTFADINLKNKLKGIDAQGVRWEWEAELQTEGPTQLFIQDNTWQPGASTGWHYHPGFSLVTVTDGKLMVYDAESPNCEPKEYGKGDTFVDAASSSLPHLIRNEGGEVATTTAVQLIPYQLRTSRRSDASIPDGCTVYLVAPVSSCGPRRAHAAGLARSSGFDGACFKRRLVHPNECLRRQKQVPANALPEGRGTGIRSAANLRARSGSRYDQRSDGERSTLRAPMGLHNTAVRRRRKSRLTSTWYTTRCSRLERGGCEAKLAGFREDAFGQNAVVGWLANRIVHNRFWHENAWL